MNQISSRSVWIIKYIFPIFWFGFLGFFIIVLIFTRNTDGGPPTFTIIVPIVMGVFGYFLMKRTVWDLADVVLDAGDSLVVRFGIKEERIPLANIINVSYSHLSGPPRVTLMLRERGRFGDEVSFAPPQRFVPFSRSPVIIELIRRVDQARRVQK
jgi:hypothetical protein